MVSLKHATFGVPAVNIGTRQKDRQKGENVIESGYDKNEIKSAIQYALYDKKFKEHVKNARNPYGDGKSGSRIVDILEKTENYSGLTTKKNEVLNEISKLDFPDNRRRETYDI